MYGFTLGRFLSADLYVQSPYNSQSLNRYSYTFNNPLSYTDPTGYRSMAGEMVIRGQTISDRQRDAIMASNRQML
ncbi:RHS repeat-associated core domain-containing protein, partial [Marinimicrobium sp. ARAG 43.8]|uniref:RHS repeat-associated core domain-containing protein n=1 Tax=Marinimicrobium sp. ARAG 43.8 TaxID=3418719 RepID=UPI003CFAC50C